MFENNPCSSDSRDWVSFLSVQRARNLSNKSVTLLELKPLTDQHLPAVLELDQLCFGGLWTLADYQRELDSPNSDLLGLFVPVGLQTLVGFGCLWAILEEAHITVLAAHPHYRRQGLGQMLLIALLQAAFERGLERATLEVRASNSSACILYQKFGFKTAGRRRGYYQDTGEDALILWLSGLQHPEFQQTLATWHREAEQRLTTAGWNLQVNLNLLSPEGYSLTMD